jgi:putative hydrolase of HD superfamily
VGEPAPADGDERSRLERRVWDEYEAADTPESRFANAVDRMQPVLLNRAAGPPSRAVTSVADAQ